MTSELARNVIGIRRVILNELHKFINLEFLVQIMFGMQTLVNSIWKV